MAVDRCPELEGDEDPVVLVGGDEDYGTRELRVPAASYWVNTGLFLRSSQSARFTARGSWRVEGPADAPLYGPRGDRSRGGWGNRCKLGELTARIGLEVDSRVWCIGNGATITAPRGVSGIVYLAAYGSAGDIPEWQDYRRDARGELTVRVTSRRGWTVPTIPVEEALNIDYASIRSGWLEVRGRHVILTLPRDLAARDAQQLSAAVERLDGIYEAEAELRGAVPYHGQRVRFFPLKSRQSPTMTAGNPVRMHPDYIDANLPIRITVAGDPWGFAHELGHTFTAVGGVERYMDTGALESWPNIFTMYAHESLGISPANGCNDGDKQRYLADESSTYRQLRGDVWLQLCLWMDIQAEHGWQIYESFFLTLSQTHNDEIPVPGLDRPCEPQPGQGPFHCYSDEELAARDAPIWGWLRDRFNSAGAEHAPTDITPILQAYRVPLP